MRDCITVQDIPHHETAFEVEHVGVTENCELRNKRVTLS